jgi:putative DNA primase/helicase
VDEKGKTDEQLIVLVQEMLGYYLLNNLKAQAVFFLVGRGANGKSVLINVVEKMIGAEYVSAMSIQSLTMNNFATSGLIGKKVNLCNEEESKYLRSDRFKALISGDLIMGERKHENHFYFHPKTKYLFATNAMPTFDGINHGIRRRMQIIQFNRVFEPHEQDRDLSDKLQTEIGGIVGWALKGAQRLVSNGYRFSQSDNVDEAILSFENQTSSALAYFRENYEVSEDPNDFMSADEMYELYRQWCEKYGKKPMSEPVFGRDIGDNIFKGARSIIKWYGGQTRRGRPVRVKSQAMDESATDLITRITEEFSHG